MIEALFTTSKIHKREIFLRRKFLKPVTASPGKDQITSRRATDTRW